jgi:hypothetical protein
MQAPTVTLKTGSTTIDTTGAFNLKANGDATIESGNSLTLRGQNTLLRSNTSMTVKAFVDLILEGSNIDIKAANQLRLRGSSIKQN